MSSYPPPGPGGIGQRIQETVELIEMELRHAVHFVNEAVVPRVRKESVSAMRAVADTLRNLAGRMDTTQNPQAGQYTNPPKGSQA
jgi:hypothetical protein